MSNTTTETTCWQVADGTGGTADLRDRFIVGAGTTYNINDMGGSTSTSSGQANVYDSGHSHDDSGHNHNVPVDANAYFQNIAQGEGGEVSVPTQDHTHTGSSDTSYASISTDYASVSDSGHSHDNSLPPYYALVYKQCIC